jgi:hypothetical protein
MNSVSLLSLLAALALLPLSAKFRIVFQLLKPAGLAGFIVAAHTRNAMVDIKMELDKDLQVPVPDPAPKPDERGSIIVNV